MKKTLKTWISLLLVMTMALTLAACGASEGKESDKTSSNNESSGNENLSEDELWKQEPAYGTTITVGFDGGVCTSPVVMADLLGYYEEEGIKVTSVGMGNNTADAVGTGQVAVGTDHIAYLLVPCVNGVDIVYTTGSQVGCKSLYVLTDSGINSTEDLIGQTVAIPAGYGSYDHNIALRFFQKDGIGTDEVNYKVVESSASILAMQNGEIQGAILGDQYAYSFVQDGTLKYIRSITWDEDFIEEPCCVIAFNRKFYEENPITTKKMTRAIQKAKDWIYANPEEAAQLMLDNNITSGEFDVIVDLINAYRFNITDEQCETTLRNVIEDYKTFGLIDDSLSTDEIMDMIWKPVLQEN